MAERKRVIKRKAKRKVTPAAKRKAPCPKREHQIEQLRSELHEAQATLRAIRSGQVDALVVATTQGDQVFALKGAERPYRLLVERMSEGAVTADLEGTILYCNHRFAEMIKMPMERVVTSSLLDLTGEEDGRLLKALLGQESGAGELRLWAADGTLVPVYVSTRRWEIEDMPGVCLVVTDLTEQKRQEAILAEGRLTRYTLEQATEPILLCDPAGRTLRASQAAAELAGRDPLYQPFDAVFPINTVAESQELAANDANFSVPVSFSLIARQAPLRNLDVRFTRADGQTFRLLLSAGPLLNGDNQPLGYVVTLVNITARVEMEETLRSQNEELAVAQEELKTQNDELVSTQAALRQMNEELETRVRERTADLERSNKDLEQFAYVSSHDLQEPLRMVASFMQLLEREYRDKVDDRDKEYIDFAVEGAVRMSQLIKDLLAYSRVNTQSRPLCPTDCELVLEHALQNLRLQIEDTQATVTHDTLPTVMGDETQLVQVFQNLIANGIKFHKDGENPAVHISAQRTNGEWLFSVHDNGIGIEEPYFKRIFVIFQRLHTRRDKYPGTGIGLAIVKRIVERHGGRVCVESKFGEGSTFYFTLPVMNP